MKKLQHTNTANLKSVESTVDIIKHYIIFSSLFLVMRRDTTFNYTILDWDVIFRIIYRLRRLMVQQNFFSISLPLPGPTFLSCASWFRFLATSLEGIRIRADRNRRLSNRNPKAV